MDHRGWLWPRRPSEKTIFATDKAEELLMIPEEGGPNNAAKNLNEKLASVLLDPQPNGGNVEKHVKITDTANAGQENVEAQVMLLKRELDEALRREMVANEMLSCSDTALRECMQQLDLVRSEQEQRILDAVMKASNEFDMAERDIEERLMEANGRLAQLTAENSHLSNALLAKEKALEDQQKHKAQMEAEFSTLMVRLDSTEKENAFLKYECRILEKEVEIRNEEMEYNRRSAVAAQRQNLETAKEIVKLEAECQRLHLLLRKRLPGPAGMAKTKSDFGSGGRRSRRTNGARDFIQRDHFAAEDLSRNLHLLVEQLRDVEEENRNLKEIVIKRDAELQQPSQFIHSQPSSRIASKHSLTSDSGHFCEGKFKHLPGNKVIEEPEMRLMDDFAEMEKLAIVSTDAAAGGLVPQTHEQRELSDAKYINSKVSDSAEPFDWLQVVLQAVIKQKCISNRSLDDLLEDIKIALGCGAFACIETSDRMHSLEPGTPDVRGYITWKGMSTSPAEDSLSGTSSAKFLSDKTAEEQVQPEVTNAISKIIQLIEGIDVKSLTNDSISAGLSEKDQSPKQLTASADYSVHVLQWRTSELCAILEQFVHACQKQLGMKADLGEFAEEVSFALDYILNNCLNPKQASNTRDKIKRHFGWNNSQCNNEKGVASQDFSRKPEPAYVSEQQSSSVPANDSGNSSYNQSVSAQADRGMHTQQEQNRTFQDKLENLNSMLEPAANNSNSLTMQLQESEATIGGLKKELKKLQEEKEAMEDQIDDQKSINEDLDTQLTVLKSKMNEVFQKCSSLEVELEYKNNCCEELEATCLELQLQLESVARKDLPKQNINHERRLTPNGWEITAASVKLAECQETILNLGKQLKVLASPREAVLFDRVFSNGPPGTTLINNKRLNKHFSLRDRMQADDAAKAERLGSPETKTISGNRDVNKPSLPESRSSRDLQAQRILSRAREVHLGSKREGGTNTAMALAIVPSKKPGISLLRKLLFRKKRGSSKKAGC